MAGCVRHPASRRRPVQSALRHWIKNIMAGKRLAVLLAAVAFATNGSAAITTQARLILSAEAARPGETVMAGVQLKMARGWHTYWRNSGDSGVPTKITWQLPDGIKAGDIQWPVPGKFTMAGLTTYVYHDEVLLMVPLTLEKDVKPGMLDLIAKVSWLECERVCLPGKAEVKTTLEVGANSKPSSEIFLFDAWKKKLPRVDEAINARAFWEGGTDGDSRAFVLEVGAMDEEDFFPYPDKAFEVQAATETLPRADG